MADIVNDYLAANAKTNQGVIVRDPMQCADGFKMSVQASDFHYCSPRDDQGPYLSVEIGFPSEAEPLITEYAEDADDLTGTVYGRVPIGTVLAVIEKHGGIA